MGEMFRHAEAIDIQCHSCQTDRLVHEDRPWFEKVEQDGLVLKPTGLYFCPECDPIKAGGVFCRQMYHVQLFTPQQCPHCANPLRQENRDWIRYFGKIVNGEKVIDPEYPRIICQKCKGEPFKIIMHEERQLGDKEAAERLVRETNFVNLQEVMAYGNMTQDHVTRYDETNQPRLERIDCSK